jgi:hypothetical protein
MAFGSFSNWLWDLALVLGGQAIVALMIAQHFRRKFEAALTAPLTPDTGDLPYQRQWDFRYWRGIGLAAAGLSVLCSILWLAL